MRKFLGFVGVLALIASASAVMGQAVVTGTTFPLYGPDGTAALPVYSTNSDPSTGFRRSSLGVWTFDSQGVDSVQLGQNTLTGVTVLGGNGSATQTLSIAELLTLSTGAATTDTTANLLPANAIIEGVVWRVTTGITTCVNYSIGDATTAARFVSANTNVALNSTGTGLLHMEGNVSTAATGPVQNAAAKIRVTCNATPGAGAIRLVVFYRAFVAPTS